MWMWWVWRFWIIGLSLVLDHWFEFSFGSLGFKSRIVVILCLDCWVVVEDGLMVCVCICVCFLADFWVCVFFLCLVDERSSAGFVFVFLLETYLCFCVWLTREIYYWVCVCVLAGDRFVFCVLGSMFLCLCSCLLCFRLVFYVLGLCS